MWKATAGLQLQNSKGNSTQADDDDWETDPDFVNDVSEQEQRWGSKTIEGSGRTAGAIDMDKLRSETEKADQEKKRKQLEQTNPGYGYGGKFGVQTDRMDKSAVGHDYEGKVEKHASQKDYAAGFGGKFGVQTDRVDKSAAGWDHIEKLEKHASQKDYSTGFGGKFGVQTDRVDKSALGWDHIEKLEKHQSQKDYAKGFGGKFGVQEDRKDKSAVGWDHKEATQKHESQIDHKIGFGGKFGIQKDRMDKSALKYDDDNDGDRQAVGTNYTKVKPIIENVKPSNLRAKFENLAKSNEEENRRRAAELKRLREAKDRRDREESAKKPIVENQPVNSVAAEDHSQSNRNARSVIVTGREGGIGNAISAFNQMQSSQNSASPSRREPIHIPKETVNASEKKELKEAANIAKSIEMSKKSTAPPPDLIPSIEIDKATTTPPPEILLETQGRRSNTVEQQSSELYQNISEVLNQRDGDEEKEAKLSTEQPLVSKEDNNALKAPVANADADAEAIYANSENLADYIEDTHIYAVAIYDYQATDDDEISFDPDDIITHIEMIDEGWWRGLCKNRYGLFPANYVQVVNEITQT